MVKASAGHKAGAGAEADVIDVLRHAADLLRIDHDVLEKSAAGGAPGARSTLAGCVGLLEHEITKLAGARTAKDAQTARDDVNTAAAAAATTGA